MQRRRDQLKRAIETVRDCSSKAEERRSCAGEYSSGCAGPGNRISRSNPGNNEGRRRLSADGPAAPDQTERASDVAEQGRVCDWGGDVYTGDERRGETRSNRDRCG